MEMDMRAEVERRLLQVANETRLRRSAEEEKKQARGARVPNPNPNP